MLSKKTFFNCIEVYQLYEVDDYHEIYEVLSTLENKDLKKTIS